ncbi:hypothetical protein L195_g014292, partial [Trifolium pratense]
VYDTDQMVDNITKHNTKGFIIFNYRIQVTFQMSTPERGDARGDLIQGFYGKLGPSNSQCGEMWSLQLSLPELHLSHLKHLLEEVINLHNLPDWHASLQHCFHEANLCKYVIQARP